MKDTDNHKYFIMSQTLFYTFFINEIDSRNLCYGVLSLSKG